MPTTKTMQEKGCPGPCHRHDNVRCFHKCCRECKTVDKKRRNP